MGLFHYLRNGLAVLLAFIDIKMLLTEGCHIPAHWALVVLGEFLLSARVSLPYSVPDTNVSATDDFLGKA